VVKDIIVNLSVGGAAASATDYAVSVAAAFQAHLAGVAFCYEPAAVEIDYGLVPAHLIEEERAKALHSAKSAAKAFEECARRNGVSVEIRLIEGTFATACDQFAVIARRFDLSVITQPEPSKLVPEQLIIEAALFDSGRPILVVPYIQKSGLALNRVMLCWDGSRNAARATADAMPLLLRADSVEVVIVAAERPKSDEMPGAEIAHHLARHGLKVSVKRIVSVETDVPNTLLSHAADSEADLIVMGGYGHSRLREFILGGATRGILAAMTVPVLMSH